MQCQATPITARHQDSDASQLSDRGIDETFGKRGLAKPAVLSAFIGGALSSACSCLKIASPTTSAMTTTTSTAVSKPKHTVGALPHADSFISRLPQ